MVQRCHPALLRRYEFGSVVEAKRCVARASVDEIIGRDCRSVFSMKAFFEDARERKSNRNILSINTQMAAAVPKVVCCQGWEEAIRS